MKRAKERWAWKAKHKRPSFQNYWSRGADVGWCHRLAQSRHRSQTREAFSRLKQGEEEDFVQFPYHHHHWLKWWWY
ncbi:MAG: hypothetical protein ACRYFX_25405 [Janthinobacterium lividum]